MSLLPLWNNDVVTVIVLLTAVLAVLCVAAPIVRRSAALRNSLLIPGLLLTFLAPTAPFTARVFNISVEIPILDGVSVGSDAPDTEAGAAPSPSLSVVPGENPDRAVVGTGALAPVDSPHLASIAEPHAADRLWAWGLSIWGAGAVAGLSGIAVSLIRLRRLLATAKPIEAGDLHSAIDRAREVVGLRHVPRLGTSNRISTPVAFGSVRHGWVLLPEGALERMSRAQLDHVLAHEAAHIAHCDPVIRIAQRVSIALWWWHPLIHVLNRQLSRTREELCDNAVLALTDPVDYGETLLSFGRLASTSRSPPLAVGLFPPHEKLEQRIRNLLNPRRSTMSRSRPSILLGACLAITTTSVLAGAVRVTEGVRPASDDSAGGTHADVGASTTREFTLSFPDLTQPGHLDVDIKRGDIIVTTHDGDGVIVRLTLPEDRAGREANLDGLKTVRATPIDFDIRQSGNTIEVNADSYEQITHLEILVPRRTNLTLDSYRDGVLRVSDVHGVVRARSQNNDIILSDVAGSADVYGYNGSFVASFTAVTGELSFETYNGSVDVTLPSDVEATTRVRTKRGVMRTDFELEERSDNVRQSRRSDGAQSIGFDEYVVADVNGGGIHCTIETTNGDILLRKAGGSSKQ